MSRPAGLGMRTLGSGCQILTLQQTMSYIYSHVVNEDYLVVSCICLFRVEQVLLVCTKFISRLSEIEIFVSETIS